MKATECYMKPKDENDIVLLQIDHVGTKVKICGPCARVIAWALTDERKETNGT